MKDKIFLAAPFDGHIDPETGEMYKDKVELLETLIKYLENKNYHVYNSHRREDWGRNYMEPDVCTPIDYKEISDSDIFIGIPGSPPSGGAHIEIGWASAMNKKMIILLERGREYCDLVVGLEKITDVRYIAYEKIEDCFPKLDDIL